MDELEAAKTLESKLIKNGYCERRTNSHSNIFKASFNGNAVPMNKLQAFCPKGFHIRLEMDEPEYTFSIIKD